MVGIPCSKWTLTYVGKSDLCCVVLQVWEVVSHSVLLLDDRLSIHSIPLQNAIAMHIKFPLCVADLSQHPLKPMTGYSGCLGHIVL